MGTQQMCGVCGKNDASGKCSECGVPLCDLCLHEVNLQESGPAYVIKGMPTANLRSATKKLTVCHKCMTEVDLL